MQKAKGYIYKITSPSGCVYIGQTTNPTSRINFYKGHHCKRQIRIYHSILKHGWENHRFEIIKEIEFDEAELNRLEVFYISEHKSFNTPHGLNLTSGGRFGVLSESSRKLLSEKLKGKVISPETRHKLRLANIGKKQSAETIAKRTVKITGKKRSDESRQRYRLAKKGIVFSPEHIQSLKNANRPPITEATKQKLRATHKERFANGQRTFLKVKYKGKKVINTSDNSVFESLTKACEFYNYSFQAMKHRMSGRTKTPTTLKWL